ncbi:MAG TPA: pyruvate formate-lyase-activating protein [Caproiciproducens sp.]|nr:pyruvate formate-lyase-activating protein [Caproiciproducens sp.]
MLGKIHSFQSLGAVDGPGLRFVVFLQGCNLRCAYCHNPDTWNGSGTEYSADEVCSKILRFRPYFGETGGVTVSGGEPLLQWEFVAELFRKLHKTGIHTALDTAGFGRPDGAREVLKHTDLVLCDLKFSDKENYRQYCGGRMQTALDFLKLTEELGVPLWIRHVVVPGLNDEKKQILKVAEIAAQYSNLKKMELLPFHKFCIPKYEAMGIDFPLKDYPECRPEEIQQLSEALKSHGFSRYIAD